MERVWACGDITTFDGKLKLIATGYAEAAIAVAQAVHHIRPEMRIQPKYSTNTGVPGAVEGSPEPGAEAVAHLRAADPVLARLLDELGAAATSATRRGRRPTITTARSCARSSASSSRPRGARDLRAHARALRRAHAVARGCSTTTPRSCAPRSGLSRAKVAFLRSLAEHVLTAKLELERLDQLPTRRSSPS